MCGEWRSVGRVMGEWGSVLAHGEKNCGGIGKCVRVWGSNTLSPTFPHSDISSLTSLPLTPTHFPTPPLLQL